LVVDGEQSFLFAASEKDVWSFAGVRSFNQQERIVVSLQFALPRTEDRAKATPLIDSLQRERTTRHVERGAEASGKREKVWMDECEFDGSETAHRNSGYRAVGAVGNGGKPLFDVGHEIFRDVVFIAIFGSSCGICVVGRVAFGHDEDEIPFGQGVDVRIVRPIAKVAAATVKKVEGWQFLVRRKTVGEDNAILDVAPEGDTVKGDVFDCDARSETRGVGLRLQVGVAAGNEGDREKDERTE